MQKCAPLFSSPNSQEREWAQNREENNQVNIKTVTPTELSHPREKAYKQDVSTVQEYQIKSKLFNKL